MSADIRSVTHRQLHQQVAERVRLDILEGRLKPGEWLRQERLAQELGVSHMPVREALKQLANEGLVEHVPYRGVRVVQFSPGDVEDLYSCRAFVESMAAAHAARAISAEELAELDSLHRRMRSIVGSQGIGDYRELNRRFHAIIYAASRRSYLLRTLAQLWAAFPTMLWSNFAATAGGSPPQREVADTAEHEAIIAALRSRDPEAAGLAMARHIEAAGRELLAALREKGEQRAVGAEDPGTAMDRPRPGRGRRLRGKGSPTREGV